MDWSQLFKFFNNMGEWFVKIMGALQAQKEEKQAQAVVTIISSQPKTLDDIDAENSKTDNIINKL